MMVRLHGATPMKNGDLARLIPEVRPWLAIRLWQTIASNAWYAYVCDKVPRRFVFGVFAGSGTVVRRSSLTIGRL